VNIFIFRFIYLIGCLEGVVGSCRLFVFLFVFVRGGRD